MTRPEGPSSAGPPGASRLAVWVAAVYAVVSALWIAFSDAFVASVAPSVQDVTWWSTLKGFGFVAVTALLLHAGLRWAIGRERRAEEALRSAVRRYELLAEHARDIILFVRRADGRILDANAAAAATYGWSRDELRAMTIYDLRVPGPAAATAALMSATDAGGIRFNAEHRRKDGTSIPVEVNSQGTLLDGERVIVSVVRDATERREREEALRESEERLALAIEAAGHRDVPRAPVRTHGVVAPVPRDLRRRRRVPPGLRGVPRARPPGRPRGRPRSGGAVARSERRRELPAAVPGRAARRDRPLGLGARKGALRRGGRGAPAGPARGDDPRRHGGEAGPGAAHAVRPARVGRDARRRASRTRSTTPSPTSAPRSTSSTSTRRS